MHKETHNGPSVFLFEKGTPDHRNATGTALKHLLRNSFHTLPPHANRASRALQANVIGVASCFPKGNVHAVAQWEREHEWRTDFHLVPERPGVRDFEKLSKKLHKPWYVLFDWPHETAGLPLRRTIRITPRLLSLAPGEHWELNREIGREGMRFPISEEVVGVSIEFAGDHPTIKKRPIIGEYITFVSPGIDAAGRARILQGLMREVLPSAINDVVHGKKMRIPSFNRERRAIALGRRGSVRVESWYQHLPEHWRENLIAKGGILRQAA